MFALIARRLLSIVPTALVVSFVVFLLVYLVPGDAAVTLAGGSDASPETIAQIRADLGLDRPFLRQYVSWLGDAVRFDFGNSLLTGRGIWGELVDRFAVTGSVALAALALIVPVALVVGIAGGLRPGSLTDRVTQIGASVALALPGFWVAMLLVTVFAVQLRWLPPFGYASFTDDPLEWARHVVMPAISLGLTATAVLSRQLRAGLADTMSSAFIRTAWAKGGSTLQVVGGHALKPSAMPAVTVLGLQIGVLLGGSVIVEQIFTLPGVGNYLLTAIRSQDIPVVQAVLIFYAGISILANLAVDLAYGYLNPKVRPS